MRPGLKCGCLHSLGGILGDHNKSIASSIGVNGRIASNGGGSFTHAVVRPLRFSSQYW